MSPEDRINSLLLRWQEHQEQGQDISAAQLCHDCPELEPRLREEIRFLHHMNALLEPPEAAAASDGNLSTQDDLRKESGPLRNGPAAAVQETLPAPNQLPGYEILKELGRGGM